MKELVPGRMVHYVFRPNKHLAAIVTDVLNDKGKILAAVFNRRGILWLKAEYDETEKILGSWHWVDHDSKKET